MSSNLNCNERRPSLIKRLSNAFSSSSNKSTQTSAATSAVNEPATATASEVAINKEASAIEKKEEGIPLTGVSLRWFIDFIENDEKVKKILDDKGDEAIMDDLLSVVIDMTKEADESFAEMLKRTQPEKRLTKETADIFISYARLYLVNDMIPTIKTLIPKDKDKDIYIWLDSLSINQNVHAAFDPLFFTKTLKESIKTISKVAVVMTPWDKPGNLTRAWCIWELYSAAESNNVNIQILIPPSQRPNEAEPLLRRALAIFENQYGKNHHDVAYCLSNIANLLREQGKLNEAEKLSRRALGIYDKKPGGDNQRIVYCLNVSLYC